MITARADATGVSQSDPRPVPWWSFGKTVLAAASLRLVAEGRLALDTSEPHSLRGLLQHRAGIAEYGHWPDYHAAVAAGDPPWPPEAVLARAAQQGPQAGWGYSNIGYLMIRRLVEATTGLDLAAALAALVWAPLGIADVRLALLPEDLAATAWGNASGYHPGWVYHGLLVGPAGAAAQLLHRLLAGDLLPPALLADMLAAWPVDGVAAARPWTTTGYGLGLMIGQAPGGTFIGHTGSGPASVAAVYHLAGGTSAGAAFAAAEAPGPMEDAALALALQG